MKKISILVLLLTSTYLVIFPKALKGILFKNILKPNSTYNISNIIDTKSELKFIASPEIIEKLKEKGIKDTILASSNLNVKEIVTTGTIKKDSSFPIEMQVKSAKKMEVINGVVKNKDKKFPLDGMKLTGLYTKTRTIKNIKLFGPNISADLEKTLKSMFENLSKNFKYPEKPLIIGDSFQRVVPIKIPVLQGIVINMKMILSYTLEKVENNKAYFKVKSKTQLTENSDKFSIQSSGGGEGLLINDLKKNYTIEYTSKSKMNLIINYGKIQIVSNSISNTKYLVN